MIKKESVMMSLLSGSKKLKRVIGVFSFLLLSSFFVFSQSYANKANRKTAERCLKIAESCLLANDYSNAKKQVELGLTYDDSISDFYYIKAAVQLHESKPKADIISIIRTAFAKDNWVSYSLNGARILLADLLCQTKLYEESMELLNQEPYIYSADAEIIRIKNLYRIGSEKSIADARSKINTSRRIYPDDERFPNVFFLFESTFKNISELNNLSYEVPEIVLSITDAYINSFPNYKRQNFDSELLASFLVEGDVQKRLFNSILSKEKNDSVLMAIAGKRAGVLSDLEAYNMFINTSKQNVNYTMLQLLMNYLAEEEVKNQLKAYLDEFEGSLLIDSDFDLQTDLTVKYDCGRPLYITYDKNCDDLEDLYAVCDLGSPLSISYPNAKIDIFYEEYPYVKKMNYLIEECSYDFVKGDFIYKPFDLLMDNLCNNIGVSLFVPHVDFDAALPNVLDIVTKASEISVKTNERKNSLITYHSSNGNLAYADFFEGDFKYAFCNFEEGYPFNRYVDYNYDGIFETVEVYDKLVMSELEDPNQNEKTSSSLLDEDFISDVFGNVFDNKNLYLKKVQIDSNSNTFFEFTEEYLENEGRINCWDYDDNGIIDNQFIKYPVKDDKIVEENIFFDDRGLQKVSVVSENDIPVTLKYKGKEVLIIPGTSENFYWIGERIEIDEKALIQKISPTFVQGDVNIVQENENRFTVVKVGDNYFCLDVAPPETYQLVGEDSVN